MPWTDRWKGGRMKHQLIIWLVANRNVCVTSNHPTAGISAIGNESRVVIKGEDATNPDTKYFNCELVLLFPLEVNLHLATGIKACTKAGPWLLVCHHNKVQGMK